MVPDGSRCGLHRQPTRRGARCPLSQAEELFAALRRMGHEVELAMF